MKNIIFLVLATALLNSCGNDDNYHYEFPDDEIYFPHDGLNGLNVLNETTTEFKAMNDSTQEPLYSFTASVPFNQSLKVIIENTTENATGRDWVSDFRSWYPFDESIDANEKHQVLVLYGQMVASPKIYFRKVNGVGSAEISFYRNEEKTPFRTKKITWEP